MPKLKKPPDKYHALKILIRGTMADQGVTQEQVGGWLGCCRQTVNYKLRSPDLLTLRDITKLAVKLDIPSDEIRAALPIR